MFGNDDMAIGLKFKLADNSAYEMDVNNKTYTIGELVKIIDEVESLRKENVALNKDCSALQNINEGLQKQVYNYQDTIANNLTGIRCKELEGEVKKLKQQVSDLEEIIRDDDGFGQEGVIKVLKGVIQQQQKELDIRSDKIHNLQTELKVLKDYCDDLSDCNKAKCAQTQDQQAVIEFQKNDIERLVKLNSKVQSEDNIVGDYLKGFVATSLSNNFVCGDLSLTVRGYVGETEISITMLDKEASTEAAIFANTLLTQNH